VLPGLQCLQLREHHHHQQQHRQNLESITTYTTYTTYSTMLEPLAEPLAPRPAATGGAQRKAGALVEGARGLAALAALAVWKGSIDPAAASGSVGHNLDAPAAPLLNASLAGSIDPATATTSGGHGMLTTDPPSAGGFNCVGSVAPADALDALPSSQCLATIGAACGAARGNSSDACLACAGKRASELKRSGCAPEDLGTFCAPRRKLRVENQLPHPVWMEALSCDPSLGDPNCKGAYPGLRKPDGGSVNVSICKVPVGHVLSFPIPTGKEIDSFKIYPKWGCNEIGENCMAHQELPPCGTPGTPKCATAISTAFEGSFNVPQPAAPGATWKKDFIDISAVDGLTVDFLFETLGDADCEHGATCTSDTDCGADATCHLHPKAFCDSTLHQLCPGGLACPICPTPKKCLCPSTCRGKVGPLTASVSFEDCPSDITLSDGHPGATHTYDHVDLRVRDAATGEVTGCASPCSYLTKIRGLPLSTKGSPGSDIADRYCCNGDSAYGTRATCIDAVHGSDHADPATTGWINDAYVKWVHANAYGVYAWPYDEKTGDALWGCSWAGGPDGNSPQQAPSYSLVIKPQPTTPPPIPNPIPCEERRHEARAVLVDKIGALTSTLTSLKDGAPALQTAVDDAETALADAEDILQDKLHAAREAQAALGDALTRFSEFFYGDWNATLTRCAGQGTTDPCRADLASANAKRNALSAVVSDASAAVNAAEAAVQEAEDGVTAAERVLSAAYDAQARGMRQLQAAVNAAAAAESSVFAAYLAAVKVCPPTDDDDDQSLIDAHSELIQVQLALAGAALATAPDPDPDAQPLSSDWHDDAQALNLSASDWPRSCPVRRQWAWKNFNITIDSAEAALSSLRSTVGRLQADVDARKQAVEDARKAWRQALAERRAAKAALQDANAALIASQLRYDASVEAKAAVELACRGHATTPVCAFRIQNATLAYNRASTDNAGRSLAVRAANARLAAAEAALVQATAALQAARDALAAAFERQQTRMQELQDDINAATARQRAASLRYRKVLRVCHHLSGENTADVVDVEWHDVDVAAAVHASSDASETHAKRLMELLLQYADLEVS
jgi:hypothetical protein